MKRRNNDLNVKELAVIHDSVQLDVLDYKTALHLFLNDCELRNLRDHTIRYYRSELTTFTNFSWINLYPQIQLKLPVK